MIGKVALITGAARGQGRSHAVALAGAGADVVLLDSCAPVEGTPYPGATRADLDHTVALVEQAGAKAVAVVADVRTPAQVREAVAEGLAAFGRLDVLVANAGIVLPAPATELTDTQWQTVIDINLTGVWNSVQACLPALLTTCPGSSIVITSSANGGIKAPPNLAAYAASKFAVVGLMRSLANEFGPQGLRLNTVHPTAVDTDMIQNEQTYRLFAPDVQAPGRADVTPAFEAFHSLRTPWVQPEDVSAAVLFLVSDQARYLTGVALPVDAGISSR